MKSLLVAAILVVTAQDYREDGVSTQEVMERYQAFNEAWERRDMDFIRDYFAHDSDMLLFFERRQLSGWSDVETLYRNMFAHATPGSVKSNYSNLRVRARGDMAYVAANFHLQVTNPEGEEMTDTGRVTVVFERRGRSWKVVHRHTSFQAPPGPQRRSPLHTDPGPLWSPQLEGAWRAAGGVMLLATGSHLVVQGVPGFPGSGRYRIEGQKLLVTPEEGSSRAVDIVSLTSTELDLQLDSGTISFQRIE